MPVKHRAFHLFRQFSQMDLAYATERAGLRDFYHYEPELSQFGEAMHDKAKDETDRGLLVDVLKSQYDALGVNDKKQLVLIESLGSKGTFTVTTAHQPSLFTGPLYFIYKAFSAIKLVEMLAEKYPENTFVPIFILGGEDHDFEEINHVNIHGERIEWKNNQQGSVSRMTAATVRSAVDAVLKIKAENRQAIEAMEALDQAFSRFESYGMAMASWVQQLLGDYGILVFNMDNRQLKHAMIPVFREELLKNSSHALVEASQKDLKKAGYGNQAFPREINLFYMDEGLRERIEKLDDRYLVLNTDLSFSEQEILTELENHPERFSPNVILRPIYQETILPNLAYVGGGGELAYWLERKSQFAHFGLNFPMLVRRDSAFWLSHRIQRKLVGLDLSLEDLSNRPEQVEKKYVEQHAKADFDIGAERAKLETGFAELQEKASTVDPTLGPMVGAQAAKMLKQIDHIGGKIRKTEKEKHRRALDDLQELRGELFPGDGLQERHDNFLSIYLSEGPAFFDLLLESFNPLDTRVKILLPK